MRITETSTYRPSAAKAKRLSNESTGLFSQMLDNAEEAPATAPAQGPSPLSSVSFLAAQEISDTEARKRKQLQEGNRMLDALERLRTALITGSLPPDTLKGLEAHLARTREANDDPALLSLLDDIELRVAVEQAKLEKAIANRACFK